MVPSREYLSYPLATVLVLSHIAASGAAAELPNAAIADADRPRAIGQEAFAAADLAHVDRTVAGFLQKYSVPGLSLAIAKDGRLVLAKGYGFVDQEHQECVTPAHLFRIASVSKPLTAIAVFTLMERGKLALGDHVFGPHGLLGEAYGLPKGFPQRGDVTVEQLLTHTAGGWPNDQADPMFQELSLTQPELIRWTLPKYDLADPPGEKFAYSNFGYLLLGRIIERVSGRTYHEYVQEAVLTPAGVSHMRLAADTLAERRPDEVLYYDRDRDSPYRVRASRMDAHGGWLATPTDLLRIVVRVDGLATKSDLLQPASVAAMTTASAANPRYAKGWSINPAGNWWHTGSLPGTFAFLARAQNGFCWAILMNQRGTGGFAGDVDQLGWTILQGVSTWPTSDLF